MGGAAAGELASEMAATEIHRYMVEAWRADPEVSETRFTRHLRNAVELANLRLHEYALEHPEVRGMGTTATVAGVWGDRLYLAQIGDSRAYLIREGEARQLTRDQSLTQRLVEVGELTEEEAEASERRNIILQALGPEANIKVDLTVQQVRKGDTLVLCSDGLSGQVRTEQIAESVVQYPDLVQLCKALIDLANANGGPDNITVVAARFEGEGLDHARDIDEIAHRNYRFSADARATMPLGAMDIPVGATAEVRAPNVRVDQHAVTPVAGMPVISEEDANRPTPRSTPLLSTLDASLVKEPSGPGVMAWVAGAVVIALAAGFFFFRT